MRRMLYLLLILGLISHIPTLHAQEEVQRIPTMRSGIGAYDYKYPKANKVHIKRYNHYEIFDEWDKYYDYSKDSLILTIRADWGTQTAKYDSDGKMTYFSSPINNWNDTYTYTDDGKILKIEGKGNDGKVSTNTLYEYTNNSATETHYSYSEVYDKLLPSVKTIYKYTDAPQVESFIYDIETNKWTKDMIENYSLDYIGRITDIKRLHINTNYTYYIHYEYTDNGYTYYERTNSSKEADKTEYTFNDHNDVEKIKLYRSGSLYFIEDYTYTYPNPSSN